MRKAASAARFPNIPVKTTAYVIKVRGALKIVFFINVSSKPTLSAKPIPSIIVNTISSGLKPTKFSNMEERIYSNPTSEQSLFTATSSSSPGCTNITSQKDIIQDKIITKAERNTNKIHGAGSLFPMLSILFKNRDTLESLSSLFVDTIITSFILFSYLQL